MCILHDRITVNVHFVVVYTCVKSVRKLLLLNFIIIHSNITCTKLIVFKCNRKLCVVILMANKWRQFILLPRDAVL